MPDDFLDPILRRIDDSQRSSMRIGVVTTIDAADASVTVSLAGDEIPGVRWIASYSPTAGDMVVVSRVDAAWVVLGKMSKQLGVPSVVYDTVAVAPIASRQGWLSGGSWVWNTQGSGSDSIVQGAGDGVDGAAGVLT